MNYLKLFNNHSQYEEFINGPTMMTPDVSHCIAEKDVHYRKKKFDGEYLTFEALESGTFTLTIGSAVTTGDVVSVSYSLDNGETWTTTNNVDGQKVVITTPTVNAGDEVLWKGNAVRMANNTGTNSASMFSSTANFNARGNVMSLLYGDEFKDKNSLSGKNNCFCYLFNNNIKLINGKNISLPATTLSNNCYRNMFRDCASITKAPEFPATTLAEYCYGFMFYGCTSIKVVSELPATTLASYCYRGMFYNCTSLTTAPELPATTLANYCYNGMFEGCTSLTTAPKLPATALTEGCYYDMFRGCSNLIVAPEISATTLAKSCCYEMFSGCTSLIVAPELPATTLATYCYQRMFCNCTSLTVAPELPATTLTQGCYYHMFNGCTNLMKGPELPATTLNYHCYDSMFYGTSVLPDTSSIDFSSETIACSGGLAGLFAGTKITDEDLNRILPKDNNNKYCLPVTSLSGYSCYNSMFEDCVNLKTAPELPATTLSDEGCYGQMFKGCTSLTTAPRVLPATTLASMCYSHMFEGCTSLTTAPELPATTLVDRCYGSMFSGCTSLNSITCLATDISAYECKNDWVKGVASSGTFIKADGMNKWTRGSNGIPTNWTVVDYSENKPFTLKTDSGNDGVFTIGKESEKVIQYSIDNGLTWTSTSALSTTVTASTVMIKSEDRSTPWCDYVGDSGITCSINFHVEGNIMSLLYGDDYANNETLINTAEFAGLFTNSSTLTSAKNLNLTSTTLVNECYASMFYGCTSLTTPPKLPATTLAKRCYYAMFESCTSLTVAPELSATTLADNCYQYMFGGCTNLTTAPVLPVTTLAEGCYSDMFSNCTSLTTAPVLPATTLVSSCYSFMFNGCASLTTAPELPASVLTRQCYEGMFGNCTKLTTVPELPATTLTSYCYRYMFHNCTRLNSITCLATDISATDCTKNWVNGVAASGTFTKAPSMTSWTTGVNGIPTNWNVEDYGTVSPSLVMYVDDFPESKLQDEGETVEYVMNRQLNSSDECNIGNKYVYTGETITYNGNTYYLWEMSDDCSWDSQVAYLLTTTDSINTLYSQSLKNNLNNHFTSLVGRLDEDKEGMYNDGEIGSEYELYLVKVIDNNPTDLRLWFDDFVDDENYQTMTDRANDWNYNDVDDYINDVVADPETFGSNAYIYTGETMVYNGTTYYLWECGLDNGAPSYILTTTVDFDTLYDNSLEADHTNEYCPYYATLNPDKTIYFTSSQNNRNWLIKIERI